MTLSPVGGDYLKLVVGIGTGSALAHYSGGSGTDTLVLRTFALKASDSATDGVYTGTAPLSLRLNATLKSAGGAPADLAHAGKRFPGHRVNAPAPVLADVAGATVTGASLVLTYDRALDEGSEPAGTAFTVTAGDAEPTVSAVTVSGTTVTLTLASAVTAADAVTLVYTVPSSNPIQDIAGMGAPAIAAADVTNLTPPVIESIEITSDPGTDGSYGVGDFISVTYTFDAAVTFSPVALFNLRLELDIGGNTANAVRYHSGSGTRELEFRTLTFNSTRVDLDGVSFAENALGLYNNATLRSATGADANLAHAGKRFPGHRVNAPPAPMLQSAAVDGATLVLTYDRALSESPVPAGTAFTVTVDGTAVGLAATDPVAVAGATVTLTLASAVTAAAAVTVAYTVPASNPVEDTAGIDAGAIAPGTAVTNRTAPVVASIAFTPDPGADDIYETGDNLFMTVTFDAPVQVSAVNGVRLELDVGGTPLDVWNAGQELAAEQPFRTNVALAAGLEDDDGVGIAANALQLRHPTGYWVRSAAGVDADLGTACSTSPPGRSTRRRRSRAPRWTGRRSR